MADKKGNIEMDNWYILTVGLPPIPEPITLAPGLLLKPLGQPLSVFDLAAAGGVGFRGWSVLEPLANACTCEIESSAQAASTPGYDTLNRAWLVSSLLVLRGFTTNLCLACSRYSWQLIAGHQGADSKLPPFKGQLLDFHLKILSSGETPLTHISPEDSQWISSHYDIFNTLASESESLRFALEAATDWRYATDIRSAVARLWAGIEAVFGISSELVYRISLLAASLTTSRGDDRKKRFTEVKKLYGMRSKIVHGDKLSDAKLGQALTMSYNLLRELLLLSIEKEHMLGPEDFDEAVFY